MQCVILAAGLGTRMGNLTKDCPKPMLPINGKPKLAHTINMLPQNISEVIIVVGYLQEKIREYFGDHYDGKRITYVTQECFNGTAAAVHLVRGHVSDRFMVIMGDDLYSRDDLELLLDHDYALLTYHTNDAQRFGIVTKNEDDFLEEVVERPHDHVDGLINIGAYMISKGFFDVPRVPISEKEFGLPQTLAAMHASVHVCTADKWQSIGSPEDLKNAENVIHDFI